MDKGIKGLLTGDLSIFVVKKIQHVISKNEAKIKQACLELQTLQRHASIRESLDEFRIDRNTYDSNVPSYSSKTIDP